MLHRAIVGSLERFIGILIEQHAGALPVWLAPVQVVVSNITDAQADYVKHVAKRCAIKGLGWRRICATRKLRIKYASIRCKSCPTSWSWATRKRPLAPSQCAPGVIRPRRDAARSVCQTHRAGHLL
jgi:hypothetical protein